MNEVNAKIFPSSSPTGEGIMIRECPPEIEISIWNVDYNALGGWRRRDKFLFNREDAEEMAYLILSIVRREKEGETNE